MEFLRCRHPISEQIQWYPGSILPSLTRVATRELLEGKAFLPDFKLGQFSPAWVLVLPSEACWVSPNSIPCIPFEGNGNISNIYFSALNNHSSCLSLPRSQFLYHSGCFPWDVIRFSVGNIVARMDILGLMPRDFFFAKYFPITVLKSSITAAKSICTFSH